MICCVTGHRPEGFPFLRSEADPSYAVYMDTLSKTIEELIRIGYDSFITGMAEGADLDFALFVLRHKEKLPSYRIRSCSAVSLPFDEICP